MLPLLLVLLAHDTTGYWQQSVRYRITAHLDEATGVLTGEARITYINRSPDTLQDFYVHQHLNAFRPASRWAMADSAEGRDRYQHMRDPDYAFERITRADVMGAPGRPDYPYAPDSTIAHWALPRPLAPGDSLTADIVWQARLSTLPRRQGRQGRRFDFAEWYPEVVVYDRYGWEDHPLYPAGEFYGEFATFDVTLDLPADQVIGATGVPICGDPGWEAARANPEEPVDYQRTFYADAPPAECPPADPGGKTVRFYAEQVHDFAFSLNPQYIYELGRYGTVAVHVLYQPGDGPTWGHGVVVARTVAVLAWLDTLFGHDEWPQLSSVHRIEGGGSQFPMTEMIGSPSLGLIAHETGHQYLMGQLANNEWREGWMDEGFTSFQEGWFLEHHGAPPTYDRLEPEVLWLDLHGWSEPVSTVSERFRDFDTYNVMIYAKAQLFFEELRYVVGDEVLHRILRTYFARWKLKHVDEDAFREVCEEVSRQDLKWLFAEWLHATPLFDYRLQAVERHRLPDGRWRTRVTIERLGDGWMPVEIGDRDTIYAVATGQPAREEVEFTSARRPGRLTLDPRERTHDWNLLDSHEGRPLVGRAMWEVRVDDPTRETATRDRLVTGWMPVVWSNDFGGVTLGVRERSNYFASYDQTMVLATVATAGTAANRVGGYVRIRDPILGSTPSPRVETTIAAWNLEGRAGAAIDWDHSLRQHLGFGPDPHVGFKIMWMATTDMAYLDPRLWDDAGTIEAGPWAATTIVRGPESDPTVVRLNAAGTLGGVYQNPGTGLTTPTRYDVADYLRLTGAASVRAPLWAGTELGVRVFAGAYVGNTVPIEQRRIMVAGANPYDVFPDPLLESAGALLVRPGLYYQAPGDGNLRAFRPDLGGRWAVTANGELTHTVLRRSAGVVRTVAVEVFGDIGLVDSLAVAAVEATSGSATLEDVGVGVVSAQRFRDLSWTMRVELPLEMNLWALAADSAPNSRWALRWLVSLSPSF